jgi:hypothetical protein
MKHSPPDPRREHPEHPPRPPQNQEVAAHHTQGHPSVAAGEEDFDIPAATSKEEGVSLEEYEDASDEVELLMIQNET